MGTDVQRELGGLGAGQPLALPALYCSAVPTIELTTDELLYLAKMNGQNLAVMEMMSKKGMSLEDLALAQQIQAKLAVCSAESTYGAQAATFSSQYS